MPTYLHIAHRFSLTLGICLGWFLLGLFLASGVAFSANGGSSNDIAQIRTLLFENLLSADNAASGRRAEDALWRFWFDQAPTSDAKALLDAGIKRREAYDYESAEKLFDELVETAPAYAEGYNQRAFIRFLREDYGNAQTDLEKVLTLEPRHFGALAGLYQIHMIQNRPKAGFRFLQQAVEIHPWLRERTALPKSMLPEQATEKDTDI